MLGSNVFPSLWDKAKFLYRARNKGIEVAKKKSKIIKKYREAIDEHIEMSKKANEF